MDHLIDKDLHTKDLHEFIVDWFIVDNKRSFMLEDKQKDFVLKCGVIIGVLFMFRQIYSNLVPNPIHIIIAAIVGICATYIIFKSVSLLSSSSDMFGVKGIILVLFTLTVILLIAGDAIFLLGY